MWDKILLVNKSGRFSFPVQKWPVRRNYNIEGLFFYQPPDEAYIPNEISGMAGKPFPMDLMVASTRESFDFALLFFIDGIPCKVSARDYVTGTVGKNSKTIVRVMMDIRKKGRHRLDMLLVPSPYGEDDSYCTFSNQVPLTIR